MVSVIDSARLELLLDEIAAARPQGAYPDDQLRLNEPEVYRLCDLIGLERSASALWRPGDTTGEQAGWATAAVGMAADGNRLLLKVVGRDILHKTEAGGVRVVAVADGPEAGTNLIAAAAELHAAVAATVGRDEVEGVLAAAFVPHRANVPGQEVLLSLRQDPAFGPCVVVGIGGTLTEWYGQSGNSTLIFPAAGLEQKVVAAALAAHPVLSILCRRSRLFPEAPVAVDVLARAVLALGELGQSAGPAQGGAWTIEEVELNPVVVSGGRLVALDGVGLLSRRKWPVSRRPTAKIRPLLAPRSAVVLGASARGANPGRIILDNLRKSAGIDPARLYAVHARESEIDGIPCFPAVGGLPEKCDLAVVAIPAEGALEAITALVEGDGAEAIILIPGGFAEAGRTDLAVAIEDILNRGHAGPGGGPVLVGGNCLGIVSRDQYNTFFLPEYKLPFRPGLGQNLALVSQSGAYLVTFASNYDGIIQPAASISFGNQMDLTAGDFLAHFAADPRIDVIACYIEGFRSGDGAAFLAAARTARAAGKRVIVMKAGKTALGAKAAASHTASLAGDYAVAHACLESAGVTVAGTLDDFEDLIKTFTLLSGKAVTGSGTGIISNAGFECSTVMDSLDGLRLATFDATTRAVLDEVLPDFAHRENPIDCTPMTGTKAFAASCQAVLDCADVDAAILSSVPVTPALDNLPGDPGGAHREDLLGAESQPSLMIDIIRSSAKPAVVVVDSGEIYDPMCQVIARAGIPVFRKIDRAARALAAFCRG
jgi:acyl-CoA synthetase (NDP forming)